jgi:hypothetical protein
VTSRVLRIVVVEAEHIVVRERCNTVGQAVIARSQD